MPNFSASGQALYEGGEFLQFELFERSSSTSIVRATGQLNLAQVFVGNSARSLKLPLISDDGIELATLTISIGCQIASLQDAIRHCVPRHIAVPTRSGQVSKFCLDSNVRELRTYCERCRNLQRSLQVAFEVASACTPANDLCKVVEFDVSDDVSTALGSETSLGSFVHDSLGLVL